jgi:hypothetical protein
MAESKLAETVQGGVEAHSEEGMEIDEARL